MTLVRRAVLLVLLALGACADLSGGGCSTRPEARLPLEMRRNIAVVSAIVDDHPATMILDTGAERTVLLASFVDRIRLKRDFRHATMIRGIGDPMATAVARPAEIRLGDVTIRRPAVIVGSFSVGDLPGGATDGLLGADILGRFDADIDIPDGTLTLYPACPNGRPPWREPYVALPGRLLRGRFIIPLQLDGATVPIAVDTGAEFSVVSARAAQAAGVSAATLAKDPPARLAVAGPVPLVARVHRFEQLRLAGHPYDADPILPVIAFPGALDGLLGMNYLRHHRIWLAYGSGRVFVATTAR